MRSPVKNIGFSLSKAIRVVPAIAVVLGLLSLACASAEPTAAPVATTAPAATAAPVATTAVDTAPATPALYVRPDMTPEIVASISNMTITELLTTFPASFPLDFDPDSIKRGGILRHAANLDISNLDPKRSAAKGTSTFVIMVYDNLVEYEQGPGRNPSNPAIVPMMAESWEFNDAGTKLTFQLNEGMYWSDLDDPFQKGPEIVAEDFIYIFTQFRDDSVQSGNYRTLESIEAPSKYTVVLNFSTPSFWILPFMASKDGVMFNPHLDKAGRADRETRGPGPFILFEAKKSIAMQFKRNPNHFSKDQWGNALPYLDGISFTVVPDQGTRIAMMRTGKVDHAENLVGNVRGLTALLGTNPEFQVMANPGSGTSWSFSYQMNNPIFADINVRRALTLAYDGVGASNVVALGYGMPGDTKFAWWDWTFEPPTWDSDLDALYGKYHNHYDVPAAKELWAKGGLGDITLTIPLYTYGQYILDTAALLVADWRELGITLKPQSQDYSAFNALLQQRTAKDMIFAWQQQGYGPVGTALVKLYSTSPGNRENLNDPIIDGLIDQLAVEGDPAKVRSLTQQIRDQYNDQIYWTASYANAISFAIVLQPWVKGVRGGEFSSLTAYYPGKLYRHTWLDRD